MSFGSNPSDALSTNWVSDETIRKIEEEVALEYSGRQTFEAQILQVQEFLLKRDVKRCYIKKWDPIFSERRVSNEEDEAWVESNIGIDADGDDVGIFMRDIGTSVHSCAVEEVRQFCQATARHRKAAWLDDRSSNSNPTSGSVRTYKKPLSANQLYQILKSKRYSNTPSLGAKELYDTLGVVRNGLGNSLDLDNHIMSASDAERRMLFIPDLNLSTLEALIATISPTQGSIPKDLLYEHLTRKATIGVTLPSQEFTISILDFHIPYYALKMGKELLKGTPKKAGMNLRDRKTESVYNLEEDLSINSVFDEDNPSSTSKTGWIDWFRNTRNINRELPWYQSDFGEQSWKEYLLGSLLLQHRKSSRSWMGVTGLLNNFKSLLSLLVEMKQGPEKCNRLTLPFILVWATPVAATELSGEQYSAAQPCASTTPGNFQSQVKSLLCKTIMPWHQDTDNVAGPEAQLIACFLCTTLTILLFTVRRHDSHQKYFVTAGIAVSVTLGATWSWDVQDFIFRYLFVGLNISLILSFLYGCSARQDNPGVALKCVTSSSF